MHALKDIDNAMDELLNDSSDLSLEQRFDRLMTEQLAFASFIMKRQRETGQRISTEEKEWQEDSMKQLNIIEKIMRMAKKYNRIPFKPNPNFESQTLQAIKDLQIKSSMPDIVQKTNQ